MIKFEFTEVIGFEPAIRGMRNPMNSWDKSDSTRYEVGAHDLALMQKLCKAGSDHRKFMRMIAVYVDITAPLYWWKEFDTYKVGTVANSTSTMHKIHAKEFVLDDFSHDQLESGTVERLGDVIDCLNYFRGEYVANKNKLDWWQMIQLLPTSYNQLRTVMLNYEVIANIYRAREGHKLDEWQHFREWAESLPYFLDIIGGVNG